MGFYKRFVYVQKHFFVHVCQSSKCDTHVMICLVYFGTYILTDLYCLVHDNAQIFFHLSILFQSLFVLAQISLCTLLVDIKNQRANVYNSGDLKTFPKFWAMSLIDLL